MQDAHIKGELKEEESSMPQRFFLRGSPQLGLLQDVEKP